MTSVYLLEIADEKNAYRAEAEMHFLIRNATVSATPMNRATLPPTPNQPPCSTQRLQSFQTAKLPKMTL